MNNTLTLPEGYVLQEHIDLQKDKKLMGIVNGLALAVMTVLAVIGHMIVPISRLYSVGGDMGGMLVRVGTLLVGYIVYMVLHELTHGVCMKHFSGARVKYGFTGMYAWAGSEAYFNKGSYIVIALAPIVVLGILLAVLNVFVSEEWFWVVYFIQIGNLSGAAGDLYVTARFAKYPKDILIRDSGVAMSVYSRQTEGKE